jgi:hypothetical protein
VNFIAILSKLIGIFLLILIGYLLYQRYILGIIIVDKPLSNLVEFWGAITELSFSAILFLVISSFLTVLHQLRIYLSFLVNQGSGIPAQIEHIESQLDTLNVQQKQIVDQLRTMSFLTHQTYEMNQTYLKKIEQADSVQPDTTQKKQ